MSDAPKPPQNKLAPRFAPGASGNPGGRPKTLPRFRVGCRNTSFAILKEIRKRMSDPDVSLAEVVKAFEAVADRGGFIPVKEEGEMEVAQARLVLMAMALEGLPVDQKQKLIALLGKEAPAE